MDTSKLAVTYAVAAVVCGLSVLAHAQSIPESSAVVPPAPLGHRPIALPERAKIPLPLTELPTQNVMAVDSGFANTSVFKAISGSVSPNSSGFTPPITIDYSGSSSALLIDATGSGKGAEVHINNPKNTASALYGITNGSGAGLTGYNQGTVGPAGKFGILNSSSAQTAVLATTSGSGSAVIGMVTYSYSGAPALLGINPADTTLGGGIGVEGQGGFMGVHGVGGDYGVAGMAAEAGTGVYGYSENGSGVVGASGSGYAGYFSGVVVSDSYISTSDRNTKTHVKLIDGPTILAGIERLPVSSWVFKKDPLKCHVGPMAQDFHTAFHLSGDDDKHINSTDITGVSLAAIQELSKEMKLKDAKIAALEVELRSVISEFSTRVAALEQQRHAGVTTAGISTGLVHGNAD